MLKIVCFFILYRLVVVTTSFISGYVQNVEPGDCVKKILLEIAKTKTFIADVSLINNEDAVIQNLQGIKGLRFVTRSETWNDKEIYNNIYVMSFKDFNNLKYCLDHIGQKDLYWNPTSHFVIILEKLDNDLVDITNLLKFFYLYNVTILIKETNDYSIYTFHSPVQPCNHRQLINVTHCSKYNGGTHIFPKIDGRDFRGCRFKLIAYKLYPMVFLDNKKLEGIEERIIKLFSEQYNTTIELVEYQGTGIFGRLVKNVTTREKLLLINYFNLDGAIGGFFMDTFTLGKYFYSYPLFVDHVTWILPRAKFLDTWHAVFTMNTSIFLVIFMLIIIFSVLAYSLALFPSREKDAMRDFLIVLGYFLNKITMRKFKNGVSESMVVCTLLLSVFILPYYIQAFFCSVQTHPVRGFEPKTNEDIKQERFNLILPYEWKDNKYFPKNIEDCGNRLQCLHRITESKYPVHYTIMSNILYQFYKWNEMDEICNTNVYELGDPVRNILRTIYYRSGSFLVKPFDDFALKYVSSGLFHKHLTDLFFPQSLKCRYRLNLKQNWLSFPDLYQPFAILVSGYCISTFCFACEIFAKTRQFRALKTRFLTFCRCFKQH